MKKKYTKTTIFLLPCLSKPLSYWRQNRLYDSYISDSDYPNDKDKIFVLVDKVETDDFRNFEQNISQIPSFDKSYDLYDGGYTMKVFNVPELYKSDYEKFKEGQYSTFSSKLKVNILRNIPPSDSHIHTILYPTDDDRIKLMDTLEVEELPNDEILSKPGIEEQFNKQTTIKFEEHEQFEKENS